MKNKILLFPLVAALFIITTAAGVAVYSIRLFQRPVQIIYVNNLTGSDSLDGSQPCVRGSSGPLRTIQKAFDKVSFSGHIVIANTGLPYRSGNRLMKGGTRERPLVVEGNGATICGLESTAPTEWLRIDTGINRGIYKHAFWPMSNQLKINPNYTCWIGTPDIWWLDRQPARNCTSVEMLRSTPGGFWWNKAEKAVWVHLPDGKAMTDVNISLPVARSGGTGMNVYGNAKYVIIRNLRSEYNFNDGFSAHDSVTGLLFQNCIAVNNCGQGFSMHGSTSVVVEGGYASRNASSGACDVGKAQVLYKSCVFDENSFEAGIYGAEHTNVTYEDCLIIQNRPFEQVWKLGQSTMLLRNCVITRADDSLPFFKQQWGSLRLEHCTLTGTDTTAASLPAAVWNLYNKHKQQ